MDKAVIITGASGGIGVALCQHFHTAGYHVIGVDRAGEFHHVDSCLAADIGVLSTEKPQASQLILEIREILKQKELQLSGIVNNAAVQILGGVSELSPQAWQETLSVNLLAPFFLVQGLLVELETAQGAVVNISSIHEFLTKESFTAYATSKAALSGMTRAMAVDLGDRVRVNAICPAAIETPMLKAGFAGAEEAYAQLQEAHPVGQIGAPEEVANLVFYLIHDAPPFLTGSCIGLDGGISGRLHDPA